MTQFHFEAEAYLEVIRAELPRYDEMQDRVACALPEEVQRVLDLGAGTGRTSLAVLGRFPDASLVLVDESPQMLAVARDSLPPHRVEQVVVGDLLGALPDGPFDAVVSALAIHHLDAPRKRQLFARLRGILSPNGCFVMCDVVVPDDPADRVTPLSAEVDLPERTSDLLSWLDEAGLDATCVWAWRDLAIVVAR